MYDSHTQYSRSMSMLVQTTNTHMYRIDRVEILFVVSTFSGNLFLDFTVYHVIPLQPFLASPLWFILFPRFICSYCDEFIDYVCFHVYTYTLTADDVSQWKAIGHMTRNNFIVPKTDCHQYKVENPYPIQKMCLCAPVYTKCVQNERRLFTMCKQWKLFLIQFST